MRNTARKREPAKCEPPMTPMIDIIFNLLIFFLLTPSFQGGEGQLTTNLPRNVGPNMARQDPDKMNIRITLLDEPPMSENVSIELNQQSLGSNFNALEASLCQLQARGLAASYPVLIDPTMAVRHKWVVAAFDRAVAAGFTNIQFSVPK